MKKRILAALMTVCVAGTAMFGLTGCNDSDAEESSSGLTAIEDVETSIYENIEEYVALGDYKNASVEVEKIEVTDEEVQEYIDSDLQYYGTTEQITEGTVADGDSINIDYVGKIDGEAFDNGSAEAQDLTIGSDTYIDGFEDALIGATIGETTTINVTFPDDYSEESLAGQAAEFDVTVNYKNGDTIPAELNDELVATMGLGDDVTTVDEYKAYVREYLEDSAADEQATNELNAIVEKLIEICEVSGFHDDLDKDTLFDEEIEYMEQYAESYGYSYDEFIALYTGLEAEEYEAELKEDIEEYVKQIMIYRAIANAEGIKISQEDYEAEVAGYSSSYESYGCESVEDFEKEYSANIYEFMIYDEVETFLKETVEIVYTEAATETAE